MISNRIKLLVVATLVGGAAVAASYAYACGEDKDKSSSAQAQYTSAEGKAGCASSKSKSASATVASTAGDHCGAKGAAKTSATLASAAGDHCGAAKGARSAVASGDCSYGENTVTFAGACPTANEADYAFAIAGAECMGTGTAVAKAIKAVPGVASVTVDYENHMAYVCADGKKASKKAIEKSLKQAGYKEVKFVNAVKDNCQKSHGKVQA